MNKLKLTALGFVAGLSLITNAGESLAYSQDPRSCADPKTQYPSNPPCGKNAIRFIFINDMPFSGSSDI